VHTIFYFEDQEVWRDHYVPIMQARQFSVDIHKTALEAERAIRTATEVIPDVAVLDIQDQVQRANVGFRICVEIKKRWPKVPVIFLTTHQRGGPEELQALGSLANYYITKDEDERGIFLLAAIDNAIKLSSTEEGPRYQRGSLTVDQSRQAVTWKGKELHPPLTTTEYAIVDCLALRAGTRVSFELLRKTGQIHHVSDRDIDWVSDTERDEKKEKLLRATLSTHISRIRKKFADAERKVEGNAQDTPSPDASRSFSGVLTTERDFGYLWVKDRD